MDATTKCKNEIVNEIVIKVYFCPFELPVHKNSIDFNIFMNCNLLHSFKKTKM